MSSPAHGSAPSIDPQAAAWTDRELADPHGDAEKQRRVRDMFTAIARAYDLNNRVHSLWMDQLWRRHAVRRAGVKPGERVLDVACGTGDLTEAFARMTEASSVVGLDYTPAMLDLARVKQERLGEKGVGAVAPERVSYLVGDAQDLPFESGAFDVLSIAFGIRNVQVPEAALAEFHRVLSPGGRLIVLEFDQPKIAPVRWFNSFYAGWVMPRTATLISGDKSGAYRYLPKSVSAFMTRPEMIAAIEGAGFGTPMVRGLSMGICACYSAVKVG